jgi:hypothetical protein
MIGDRSALERLPVPLAASSFTHLGQAVTVFGYSGSANEDGRHHHLTCGMEQTWRPAGRVPDRPFELQELTTSARRPNCGVTLGDASLGAALLEAAQTALGLAEAELATGRRSYATETYRRTVPVVGPPQDSVEIPGSLAGWPIQSADPDSLRRAGFVPVIGRHRAS